jgi:hypothetical protein
MNISWSRGDQVDKFLVVAMDTRGSAYTSRLQVGKQRLSQVDAQGKKRLVPFLEPRLILIIFLIARRRVKGSPGMSMGANFIAIRLVNPAAAQIVIKLNSSQFGIR